MAKTIPSAWNSALVNPADLSLGRFIRAESLEDIAEHQHYLYVRHGFKIPGMLFATAWQTTSASYTTTSASASHDLDTWFGCSRMLRIISNGGSDRVFYELATYSSRCTVRATLYNMATGASITTITATNTSATPAWTSATSNPVSGPYVSGGSAIQLGWNVEALATSGTANLYAFGMREFIITDPADLPDS